MAFLLYETTTGALVTSSSLDPSPPYPAEYTLVDLTAEQFGLFRSGAVVWDPVTLSLVPVPVPVTIVVSDNLRTKMKASIDEVVNVGFPAITAAQTAVDEVIAANPSNVSQVVTQYEKLAAQVRTSLRANEEALARVCAITRLLLGDFYGDADTLQSEAGTEAA
jgi:hypothetical protein